ncbi:hypothetical protein PLICRDRAFT_112259 [Plicaturopsis crispa FD-325 SS-3]|nr:hypothetical protein PLICRDRAFT_112259 [Plicaturopsis crispa FD-325 SS-3]
MLQICRAEDGEVTQVNATLRDIERTGSLELFLHRETGVDEEAILVYLSDGQRLRSDNLRELAGAHDQSIYVFNKYYLDFDLEEVLQELRVVAPLQPPIEESIAATPPFRPSQLADSYVRTAHAHQEHITHTLSTLQYQHEAVRIASSSLDLNVLAIADAFEGIAMGARRELDKQASLLAGLDADLQIINRVKIHVEFMSPAVRKAIEAGEKSRTLGDYVSDAKMRQVADICARAHDDLESRFSQTEQSMSRLREGTDAVRSTVADTRLLDDANACLRRSHDISDKITDVAGALESPAPDPDELLQELKRLDTALRHEVQLITDIKNAYTEQCIGALRQISLLNSDVVQLPVSLTSLQASFRGKNSFSHIQRLHNMLYAYGATVIEVVRRKEFARFFYQRAQSILEVMAKVSASERKRRQVYRGEVHGQLPFDTKGMDDPVPTIDFSPSGNLDATYSLEREDVEVLFRVLDDLERVARSSADTVALGAVRESRIALEKLVTKMDNLEAGFDRIAERSLLSASRLSSSRRRATEADDQMFSELAEQLRVTQEAKEHQEAMFQEERTSLQMEIHRLKSSVQDVDATVNTEQERADRVERDLHQARAQVESEINARRILEERHADLRADAENQRQSLANALSEATQQAREAEMLRQELAQVRAEFEDVKALEAKNEAKFAGLLEDQATTLRNLEEARARGEDLSIQIQSARTESDDVTRALKDAAREKDRLLRAQAAEHDRIMRDHIAEADGDRAVLEHQFSELKAEMEHVERELKDARAQGEIDRADAVGLRVELQRVEHELRESRHAERALRADLEAGQASQSDYEHRLENSSRLVAQILDVAIAFRNSHVKALSTAQTMTAHPSSLSKTSPNLLDASFPSGLRHSMIGAPDEPSPIDHSDPASALEQLRAFDHDHFLETIGKAGSTIRKWQKQCKEYRERAKGKISFRNFAKGDLALFLPTRNSVSKPWAAFNVSFPHYFLQANGHLAEQLKTREWIVARITSITERVVDHNDPTSNPYGLGDGVKYYMLEVEDWTQPNPPTKRKVSSRKVPSEQPPPEATVTTTLSTSPTGVLPPPPPGPPQGEVEDSFRATHPPTSHLFPVRSRANSSPTAGPSSLSRLLAQAPVESNLGTVPSPRDRTPSPATSPPPPPSPSHAGSGSGPHSHVLGAPSPLRPASRSSRISTSSRFSVGRIPPLGSSSSGTPGAAKAAPTTALTEHRMSPVPSPPPSSNGDTAHRPDSPSPTASLSEGMSNMLSHRRRTASYHVPRVSPLAKTSMPSNLGPSTSSSSGGITASSTLANLASSWGVSFGRRKKSELANSSTPLSPANATGSTDQATESTASELLKRF